MLEYSSIYLIVVRHDVIFNIFNGLRELKMTPHGSVARLLAPVLVWFGRHSTTAFCTPSLFTRGV